MRLIKLKANNQQAKKIRIKDIIKEDMKNVDEVLYFQALLYISEIIYTELINQYRND